MRARAFQSVTLRSDLFEGPFVALFIDHVGPIRPSTKRENRYILTRVDALSGFDWALPTPDNGAETTATFLLQRVFCDLAGFPIILRHDRHSTFMSTVMEQINASFGIESVVGASWRPQLQGPVESFHRKLALMLRTLASAFPEDWDLRVTLAVWSWRTTPQPSLGGLSPYRVILGLEPRTPFSFASAPVGRKKVDVEDFVRDMLDVHESTQRYVREFKREQKEMRNQSQARHSKSHEFEVGDFAFVLRSEFVVNKRPGPISKKLLHRVHDDLYQIFHKLNQASYIAKKASSGEDPEGFSNPINLARRIPATSWFVAEPSGGAIKRLEICDEDGVTYRSASLVGYGYGRKVQIRFDGASEDVWVDLTKEQYRWLATAAVPA